VEFEIRFTIHGSLLLVPIFYASIRFGWIGSVIMSVCSIIAMLPYLSFWSYNRINEISNIFYLLIISLGFGFFILLIRWRRREKMIMVEKELQRQSYITQIFQAQEDERAYIAHELHDEAIQTLIAMSNRIQSIKQGNFGILPSGVEDQVEWIHDTTIKISQELRRLSRDLRLNILENLGLLPALLWLVNQMKRRNDVENATFSINGEERKLTPNIDIMIFRIVQESLTNIKRHARATNVVVSMVFQPDLVQLTIKDDGCGFILPQNVSELLDKGHLGLLGIQQRAKLIGGNCEIKSVINQGTTISIAINTAKIKAV
jgi:two-component system, NarL family, sensor histidine kinase DegS